MDGHDDSTFLAIMAICIVIACVSVLLLMPPEKEIPPLTQQEKQAVINRW